MSISHTLYHWRVPIYLGCALILAVVMQLSIKGHF